MDKNDQSEAQSRRSFLKLAATTAPAALAATTLVGTSAEAGMAELQDAAGLQDTAHTRAYLESTKF